MKVKLPANYDIKYPLENEDYYSPPHNETIRKLLFDASSGYCMYCGRKVITDNEEFGHLEHSVDKGGNKSQDTNQEQVLRHCKYNIALACPKCNLIYKKKIEKIDVSKWKDKKCPNTCDKVCDDYNEMKEKYTTQNQMFLQPLGYSRNGSICSIDYDLLYHLYEPGSDVSDSGLQFLIGNHIERFDLNGDRFSNVLLEICENIVDFCYMGVTDKKKVLDNICRQRYENIIGILFVNYIVTHFSGDDKSIDNLYDFCKLLLLLNYVI